MAKSTKSTEPTTSTSPVSAKDLSSVRAHWPAPGAVARAAYASQWSDAECAERGTATKAVNVRNESGAWILTIHKAFGTYHTEIGYSGSRLVYFLDTYEALAAAIAAHEESQGNLTGRKQSASDALVAARTIGQTLADRLAAAAGNRPAERRALDATNTPASTPEETVHRLRNLTELAASWLTTRKAELAVLVAEAQITRQLVDAVRKAADDLEVYRREARSERRVPKDPPAVNLLEGRVLCEMRFVREAFERARAGDKRIPALVPGPGTRAVILGRSHASKRADKTPSTPAGGDGAVAETPVATKKRRGKRGR